MEPASILFAAIRTAIEIAPAVKDLLTSDETGLHIALTPEQIQELETRDARMHEVVNEFTGE